MTEISNLMLLGKTNFLGLGAIGKMTVAPAFLRKPRSVNQCRYFRYFSIEDGWCEGRDAEDDCYLAEGRMCFCWRLMSFPYWDGTLKAHYFYFNWRIKHVQPMATWSKLHPRVPLCCIDIGQKSSHSFHLKNQEKPSQAMFSSEHFLIFVSCSQNIFLWNDSAPPFLCQDMGNLLMNMGRKCYLLLDAQSRSFFGEKQKGSVENDPETFS